MLWRGAEWKLKKCGRTSCVLRAPNGSVLPFTHMGVSVSSKKQQNTDDNDIDDNLCSRDDTSMQLFHFSFCVLHSLVSMMTSLEQNGGDKRKKQYWRPDWKFPCWRLQLSPSCIPIPKHGRHSTLYICILYAHCEKEWTRFLPTQTSVASPQRNKSVMSSFCSSSFNMDSFWMQQRPLNVNTWLIKLRGKEFLISEFKKGYNLFEVVKEARVGVNKRFLPLQNCLCCHWNLRFNVF